MNVTEIPWTQIGAFGGFTLLVLALVLWFVLKLRKPRNTSGGTINKAKCINDPRFSDCITDQALTRESMKEIKVDMKSINDKTVEQTGILKGVLSETKKQTDVLQKVCTAIEKK